MMGWGRGIVPIRTSSRRHSSDGDMYANQRHIVKIRGTELEVSIESCWAIECYF